MDTQLRELERQVKNDPAAASLLAKRCLDLNLGVDFQHCETLETELNQEVVNCRQKIKQNLVAILCKSLQPFWQAGVTDILIDAFRRAEIVLKRPGVVTNGREIRIQVDGLPSSHPFAVIKDTSENNNFFDRYTSLSILKEKYGLTPHHEYLLALLHNLLNFIMKHNFSTHLMTFKNVIDTDNNYIFLLPKGVSTDLEWKPLALAHNTDSAGITDTHRIQKPDTANTKVSLSWEDFSKVTADLDLKTNLNILNISVLIVIIVTKPVFVT